MNIVIKFYFGRVIMQGKENLKILNKITLIIQPRTELSGVSETIEILNSF